MDLLIKKTKRRGDKKIYAGVASGNAGKQDDNRFISHITRTLKSHNITVLPKQIQVENHKTLPDLLETCLKIYLSIMLQVKLSKKIYLREEFWGLTSYFRSAAEALLPRYADTPEFIVWKKYNGPFKIGVYEKS